MNIIKRGYTLAEVLITLAVVGTIATITMPSLQTNTQRAQVVPALQKAVNTLTNVNKQIILDEEVRALASLFTPASALRTANYLDYLITRGFTELPTENRYHYVKLQNGTAQMRLAKGILSRDGIAYLSPVTTGRITVGDDVYLESYIDVNGLKGPNTLGKDVFAVLVNVGNGIVSGYGTTNAEIEERDENDEPVKYTWQTQCPNNEVPTDYKYCAAAIIENGWQIKYKY